MRTAMPPRRVDPCMAPHRQTILAFREHRCSGNHCPALPPIIGNMTGSWSVLAANAGMPLLLQHIGALSGSYQWCSRSGVEDGWQLHSCETVTLTLQPACCVLWLTEESAKWIGVAVAGATSEALTWRFASAALNPVVCRDGRSRGKVLAPAVGKDKQAWFG